MRGIHLSPVNSPHKGQWRRALMLSLTWVWIYGWVNNLEAGDLRRHRVHYDVTVMTKPWVDQEVSRQFCFLSDYTSSTFLGVIHPHISELQLWQPQVAKTSIRPRKGKLWITFTMRHIDEVRPCIFRSRNDRGAVIMNHWYVVVILVEFLD